jgi:hypothetical protein
MSHLYTALPTLWKVNMLLSVVDNYKHGSYEEPLHLLPMWNHLHLMKLDAIQHGPKLQLSSIFLHGAQENLTNENTFNIQKTHL